jgi:hypothetical protein
MPRKAANSGGLNLPDPRGLLGSDLKRAQKLKKKQPAPKSEIFS